MRILYILTALLFNISFSQLAHSSEGIYKCTDDELVEHIFWPEHTDEEWLLASADGLAKYPITHKSKKYILSEKTITMAGSSVLYIVWIFDRGDKTLTRRKAAFGSFKGGFGQDIDVKMVCIPHKD